MARISSSRLDADLAAIASYTRVRGVCDRPTFSEPWASAVDYVRRQAESAGCRTWFDAFGNLHARPRDLPASAAAWLSGSHLDSVPTGGRFDGVTGVIVALEVLRACADAGRVPPLELVVFAEEEGTTFGLGMLGSRCWAGTLKADALGALRDVEGVSPVDRGRVFGVVPDRFDAERLTTDRYRGMIEIHPEQGASLWRCDQPLGIVAAINGRRQLSVRLRGQANHAGSTSMADRRDALTGAAVCITALERMAIEFGDGATLTVGRLSVRPNAVNVIPGEVEFSIDFRSPSVETLETGCSTIRRLIHDSAARRVLTADVTETERLNPQVMHDDVVLRLRRAGEAVGLGTLPFVTSGALHDAAILAPVLPTAMVFVASREGISHNPEEFSRTEDLASAARVLAYVIHDEPSDVHTRPVEGGGAMTLKDLNATSVEHFVATCGGVFENSPWVAERAATRRPFESVEHLHATMRDVVTTATPDERLALIRAHPDLVGRMARENRLTPDSAAEQRSAGLTTLRPEEIQAFERSNAAYRRTFGFPFVICARDYTKAEILRAFERRLSAGYDEEVRTALAEIARIAWHRLRASVVAKGGSS